MRQSAEHLKAIGYKDNQIKRKEISVEDYPIAVELINLYLLCKTLRTLPKGGGLLDQDWLIIHFFTVIASAYAEVESAELKNARRT